jgi:hypothetical protein
LQAIEAVYGQGLSQFLHWFPNAAPALISYDEPHLSGYPQD